MFDGLKFYVVQLVFSVPLVVAVFDCLHCAEDYAEYLMYEYENRHVVTIVEF